MSLFVSLFRFIFVFNKLKKMMIMMTWWYYTVNTYQEMIGTSARWHIDMAMFKLVIETCEFVAKDFWFVQQSSTRFLKIWTELKSEPECSKYSNEVFKFEETRDVNKSIQSFSKPICKNEHKFCVFFFFWSRTLLGTHCSLNFVWSFFRH